MDESEKREALSVERIANIIMHRAVAQQARVRDAGIRFVHYTSAEAGIAILRSGRMLLRNSTLMNDFSEVQHGIDCLTTAYNGPIGERLKAVLQVVQNDLPGVLEQNFNDLLMDVRAETYLISISEHGDPVTGDGLEDHFGRLSMWRAYAQKNGIAFVFKNTPFLAETNALNAFTYPVSYATPASFCDQFSDLVDQIEAHQKELIDLGGFVVHELLQGAFRFAIQATKHPAFSEEREWRVIYAPSVLAKMGELTPEQFEKIPTEIKVLRGVPQRVFAIPFRNYPDEGFLGATIPELIDRVLIGPSPDSYAIAQAFVAELQDHGVEDAPQKVIMTGIPLRV